MEMASRSSVDGALALAVLRGLNALDHAADGLGFAGGSATVAAPWAPARPAPRRTQRETRARARNRKVRRSEGRASIPSLISSPAVGDAATARLGASMSGGQRQRSLRADLEARLLERRIELAVQPTERVAHLRRPLVVDAELRAPSSSRSRTRRGCAPPWARRTPRSATGTRPSGRRSSPQAAAASRGATSRRPRTCGRSGRARRSSTRRRPSTRSRGRPSPPPSGARSSA